MSLVAHKYVNLKSRTLKSGWEWNDSEDLNLKITKLITDDIDFEQYTTENKRNLL